MVGECLGAKGHAQKMDYELFLYLCAMHEIFLSKGKEKAVLQRHPWVFSGAVANVMGKPQNGEVVKVVTHKGDFLAYAFYHKTSRISARLLEWDAQVKIDEAWFRTRIRTAIALREGILQRGDTNTCRLIFSEADFLPGLIVDKFDDYLSVQILSAGMDAVKEMLLSILAEETQCKGILDKSDAHARSFEELPTENGLLWGEMPPEMVKVMENGVAYHVHITEGQKSGFYCDQRANRAIVAQYAKGKKVLDAFCYSGGFTLNALKYGAKEVVSVDSSALAIDTLLQNVQLNDLTTVGKHAAIQNDVNKQLRAFKDADEKFDLIILDPPKYAPTRSSLDKAARAYKDLNRYALYLLERGGLLATFSCSGAVDIETFKQILAWAALDAGKEIQIIHQFCQPEDHPVRTSFVEGEYLKGLLLRVV